MARQFGGVIAVVAAVAMAAAAAREGVRSEGAAAQRSKVYPVQEGTLSIQFYPAAVEQLGWTFIAKGAVEELSNEHRFVFPVRSSSTLQIQAVKGVPADVAGGAARVRGGLVLTGAGGVGGRVVIGNPAVGVNADGIWTVTNTLGEPGEHHPVFELSFEVMELSAAGEDLQVAGEFWVAESWADYLGFPEAAGMVIGSITLQASLAPSGSSPIFGEESLVEEIDAGARLESRSGLADVASDDQGGVAGDIGPDIIVAILYDLQSYGTVGGISAFAVGTNSCNLGDERANWFAGTNQHPVIPQNMFRLKDDRFEQIGMSWVKHGFMALQQHVCDTPANPCQAQPSTWLGVMCSDPYGGSLNGSQGSLGARWQLNAHTGYFPYPPVRPGSATIIAGRLQVHDTDLDPALNPGAVYFVDSQYVSSDEALAGNGNNSVSYRRISISGPDVNGKYTAGLLGGYSTQREQAAIRAWQDYDPYPSVVETDVQIPGEGLLILAAKATDLGGGVWQYEYALQNVNSDRSVGSFSVPLPAGAVAEDFGFHDVDYHSGEPWDGTDWPVTVAGGAVTWSTESYATDPDANALRWGTIYNFRFQANVGPDTATVGIDLFKPGSPDQVAALTIGPGGPVDCNWNGISDECDIDCGLPAGPCDVPDCGQSADCNINGVPDECEIDENSPAPGGPFFCTTACDPDCNANGVPDECDVDPTDPDGNGEVSENCNDNGVPDECDIADCAPEDPSCADCQPNDVPDECDIAGETSEDCTSNGVPDECEPDCNVNGVADSCDIADCLPDDLSCQDCQPNGVPDECDPDCDGDGIPDDCDPPEDCDGDGFPDCSDLCLCTTPEGACTCPEFGTCCWPAGCIPDYRRDTCIAQGGTPDCIEPLCRAGCVIGDSDEDGDLDMQDCAALVNCFTGPLGSPGYVIPTVECLRQFDWDEDDDVDQVDFKRFWKSQKGP